eukprot:15435228-Alexandrium_andersonii.AAC.2
MVASSMCPDHTREHKLAVATTVCGNRANRNPGVVAMACNGNDKLGCLSHMVVCSVAWVMARSVVGWLGEWLVMAGFMVALRGTSWPQPCKKGAPSTMSASNNGCLLYTSPSPRD